MGGQGKTKLAFTRASRNKIGRDSELADELLFPEPFTVDIYPARTDMRNSGRTISVNNALTRYTVITAANYVMGGDDPIDARVQLDIHRLVDTEFLDRLGVGRRGNRERESARGYRTNDSFLSIAAPTSSDIDAV